MSKCLTTACKDCPWSRGVKPGALGGSPPETFLGQAVGPFILPCHHDCDFDDPDWKRKIDKVTQCAGAAVFRANIGVSTRMPGVLQRLDADTDAVFSTPAEFLAHHKGITLAEAREVFNEVSLVEMGRRQMARPSNVEHHVTKVGR